MAPAESPFRQPGAPERFVLEPLPLALLDDPLEYILADHARQRALCEGLRRLAATGLAPLAEADHIVTYLGRDLDWHHEDEDRDLFPMLARRALPEDDLGPALVRLGEDHERAEPAARAIIDALSRPGRDDPIRLDDAAREVMRAYAASEHQHLAIENGVVMAIARVRLKRADLKSISAAMKIRRGVTI